jgi:hypothetical protein
MLLNSLSGGLLESCMNALAMGIGFKEEFEQENGYEVV